MANKVIAQVSGGSPRTMDGVEKVKDVRRNLNLDCNYIATVNGEPASDNDDLEDYNQVHFAPATKGA